MMSYSANGELPEGVWSPADGSALEGRSSALGKFVFGAW